MGKYIKTFTVGRNFLKRTIRESADAAMAVIREAEQGAIDLQALKSSDNGRYNVIRDLITFTGIIKRVDNSCEVTAVGRHFSEMYDANADDAWRWLVTRSLWLYVIPNGTDAAANKTAKEAGDSFAFFRSFVGLLVGLWSQPGEKRFLAYEELCLLLESDANWMQESSTLLDAVLEARREGLANPSSERRLLGDLEDAYGIGRDNLNTVLNKAFLQTGLFEYRRDPSGSAVIGISISANVDPVLLRRIRFVIDTPVAFPEGGSWIEFLALRSNDLPLEIASVEPPSEGSQSIPDSLSEPVLDATADRALEILKSRKNVILFGPPGTGKTHSALAICDKWRALHGEQSVIFVTFHPAFGYEDFVQGFRPTELNPSEFTLQHGPLLLAASAAADRSASGGAVLVVIDEINRADTARAFGELITFIEPDKRGRPFRLAQSPSRTHYLPENLFFLGTMNTADKSISLLDIALRRRFAFLEVLPDATAFERVTAWRNEVDGVALGDVLAAVNQRLLKVGIESDRALGQSLLSVSSSSPNPAFELSNRFEYDVIPLVQEYCYHDRTVVRQVLGPLVSKSGRRAWESPEHLIQLLKEDLGTPINQSAASQAS